jgi:hypothetical protein
MTFPAGGGQPFADVEFVRRIQQLDQPCVTPGLTNSRDLRFAFNVGESWVVDCDMVFTGAPGYVTGFAVVLNQTVAGAWTSQRETFFGALAARTAYVQYADQGVAGGSGTFGTFDMSGGNGGVTVQCHAAYLQATGTGVYFAQFGPIGAGAGNIILKHGSRLLAYRVD